MLIRRWWYWLSDSWDALCNFMHTTKTCAFCARVMLSLHLAANFSNQPITCNGIPEVSEKRLTSYGCYMIPFKSSQTAVYYREFHIKPNDCYMFKPHLEAERPPRNQHSMQNKDYGISPLHNMTPNTAVTQQSIGDFTTNGNRPTFCILLFSIGTCQYC